MTAVLVTVDTLCTPIVFFYTHADDMREAFPCNRASHHEHAHPSRRNYSAIVQNVAFKTGN